MIHAKQDVRNITNGNFGGIFIQLKNKIQRSCRLDFFCHFQTPPNNKMKTPRHITKKIFTWKMSSSGGHHVRDEYNLCRTIKKKSLFLSRLRRSHIHPTLFSLVVDRSAWKNQKKYNRPALFTCIPPTKRWFFVSYTFCQKKIRKKKNFCATFSAPPVGFFQLFSRNKKQLFFVTRPFVRLDCHTSSSSNTAVCNRQQGPVRCSCTFYHHESPSVFFAFRPSSQSVSIYTSQQQPPLSMCV